MGRIYLNDTDRDVLIAIRDRTSNEDELYVLNKILHQNEANRIKYNNIARIYKNEKRKTNKNYARSKKEIEKMR